jgi:hypothetical protein
MGASGEHDPRRSDEAPDCEVPAAGRMQSMRCTRHASTRMWGPRGFFQGVGALHRACARSSLRHQRGRKTTRLSSSSWVPRVDSLRSHT